MDGIETIIWLFSLGFILTFLGLLLIVSENFASSVLIDTLGMRFLIGIPVLSLGVLIYNIALYVKDKIKI